MSVKVHSMLLVAVWMAGTTLALPVIAAEVVAAQKDKAFAPTTLTIKVGDTVEFRNDDPFFHNVFSLSEVKSFDLGSYPKGQSRKVTFDKPGVVEVECAIHSQMHLKITVTP